MTQKQLTSNRYYANTLKWTPGEIVDGATDIDDAFVTAVEALQSLHKLDTDGVVGPATYRACLLDRIAALSLAGGDRMATAGKIAVCRAIICWTQDIKDDTKGAARIDSMIRTTAGLNWTWEPAYTPDSYEWCGAFAAYCWRDAIPVKMRQSFWSSTYRLDRWARYLPFENTVNPKPLGDMQPRCIVNLDERSTIDAVMTFGGTGPRAGDIVLVGGVNTGYGKHITLVESFDPGSRTFKTLEGNAYGYGPHNDYRQGVVRATRPLGLPQGKPNTTYFARRLIRPAPGDLL